MMKKLKEGRGGKLTSGGETERRKKKVHLSVTNKYLLCGKLE